MTEVDEHGFEQQRPENESVFEFSENPLSLASSLEELFEYQHVDAHTKEQCFTYLQGNLSDTTPVDEDTEEGLRALKLCYAKAMVVGVPSKDRSVSYKFPSELEYSVVEEAVLSALFSPPKNETARPIHTIATAINIVTATRGRREGISARQYLEALSRGLNQLRFRLHYIDAGNTGVEHSHTDRSASVQHQVKTGQKTTSVSRPETKSAERIIPRGNIEKAALGLAKKGYSAEQIAASLAIEPEVVIEYVPDLA